MNNSIVQQYKPILTSFIISIIAIGIHKLLFYLFFPNQVESSFTYSIVLLYCFFFGWTTIILFILVKVYQSSINNVGFTYLLLTGIKMVFAYVFVSPILDSKLPYSEIERNNFFITFILFLAIETIVTIGILNKKQ